MYIYIADVNLTIIFVMYEYQLQCILNIKEKTENFYWNTVESILRRFKARTENIMELLLSIRAKHLFSKQYDNHILCW